METLTRRPLDLKAYIQLARPANILTAWADILAGYAAAGQISGASDLLSTPTAAAPDLLWLIVATTGLYGGGITFNDVFDAELDARERPERPIPSDRVSRQSAAGFGALLLAMGLFAAAQVSWTSALLAIAVAAMALLYDGWGKRQVWLSPLNMGLCRGGNLLLGVSVVPAAVISHGYLALIPVVYIGAVTAVSQGEVHGGRRSTGIVAIALAGLVIIGVLALGGLSDYRALDAAPFIALFSLIVLPPFAAAARDPSPATVMQAVKSGVLCLIILNAAIAAGFLGWPYGLVVLALLPASRALARLFSVT
ncbi:MAG: UbiA-like protein EboC [Elainellaceae cyanobacterium]